jgi:hypothetical protein
MCSLTKSRVMMTVPISTRAEPLVRRIIRRILSRMGIFLMDIMPAAIPEWRQPASTIEN